MTTSLYIQNAPIADGITCDRFEELTGYLHFVNNESLPIREEGYSSLHKVDPVITALKKSFQTVYYPHCEISIDEAMIPFKGRSPSQTSEARIQGVGNGRRSDMYDCTREHQERLVLERRWY